MTTTTNVATAGRVHPLPAKPIGIIFDMDGTITKPCIDFAGMRSRIYAICDSDPRTRHLRGDVLELVRELSNEQQIEAKQVFDNIEHKAIEDMQIMDGVIDFVQYLDDFGIKRAVLTRNVGSSIVAMQDLMKVNAEANGGMLLNFFDPVVARDTTARDPQTGKMETLKSKPEPDAILHICEQWGCHTADVIMIGDSAADDVACAYRAGCASVLVRTGKDNDAGGGDAITKEETEERIPTVSVNAIAEFHKLFSSTYYAGE